MNRPSSSVSGKRQAVVGPPPLSRREREILDLLYRRGAQTAAQVLEGLADPPSYSAVRALLRILEDKGHVLHRQEGPRYVYTPVQARDRMGVSALEHLISTFFNGSAAQVMAALLDASDEHLTAHDLDRMSHLIEAAKQERKGD